MPAAANRQPTASSGLLLIREDLPDGVAGYSGEHAVGGLVIRERDQPDGERPARELRGEQPAHERCVGLDFVDVHFGSHAVIILRGRGTFKLKFDNLGRCLRRKCESRERALGILAS